LYVIGWLQCVKQYIEVQIDDNHAASITCPDPDCRRHGVIDAAEVTVLLHTAFVLYVGVITTKRDTCLLTSIDSYSIWS